MPISLHLDKAQETRAWAASQLADIRESAMEAVLTVTVSAGRRAMEYLMDAEVNALVGPKGKHDQRRRHVRHGTEQGSVIVAGQRIQVRRPRVRAPHLRTEIPLATYELFTRHDLLSRAVLEDMLARLSGVVGPGQGSAAPAASDMTGGNVTGGDVTGVSTAVIKRDLIAATETELSQILASGSAGRELAAMVVASVRLAGSACLAVLGVGSDGAIRLLLLAGYQSRRLRAAPDLVAQLRAHGVDAERLVLGATAS